MLMQRRDSCLRAAIAACFAAACFAPGILPGGDRTYGKDEYVTVNDGRSPGGKYAIAAHGEGEGGYDNFHLYLMDAKTGKKIGLLEEIKDVYEDDADVFDAQWSADSLQVSITYRAEKHVTVKIRYRIVKGRAFRLSGPEAQHLPDNQRN